MGLVNVPHVSVLVHYQHSQLITSLQQSLGTGVMSRTNSVVACLLQQANFSCLCCWVTYRPQDSVVVVDAGPSEDDPLPVEAKAVLCVARHKAHTKGNLSHILSEFDPTSVKVWTVRTPQLGAGES